MALYESDLVEYYKKIWLEADSYYSTNVKQDWDRNRNMYTDTYLFKKKLDWQTTVYEPVADSLITRLANYFNRILVTSEDTYYDIFHKNDVIAQGFKDIVGAVLLDTKFPLVFNDAFKAALLTSPYITRVDYLYDYEPYPVENKNAPNGIGSQMYITGRTQIKDVNPYDFRLDPNGDAYQIETKRVDLATFTLMARLNNWKHQDDVAYDVTRPAPSETPNRLPMAQVRLDYVWTRTLTDKTGALKDRNIHFIIANGKWIVYFKRNILPRSMSPYVVGFPMKNLVGRYGRGYLTKLHSVLITYLESINLIMDMFKLMTLGAFEVDTSAVDSASAHIYSSGIVPGKMYPTIKPNSIRQIFQSTPFQLALPIVQYMDKIVQNNSFQSEFFQGAPTVKGRPTAQEITTKTQQSTGFLSDIANELERTVIIPTIELVLTNELIYMDDPLHVDLSNHIKSSEAYNYIRSMPFNERIKALRESQFEARGISGKVIRMGMFNKFIQILNVIANIPEIVQQLDPAKVSKLLFQGIDLNEDLVLRTTPAPVPTQAAPGQPQAAGNQKESNQAGMPPPNQVAQILATQREV
jgi:hypothetical protein